MKKLALIIITSFVFISCSTVPVPGYSDIARKNIYNEYMNIADAYLDLKKFDKAELYYEKCLNDRKSYWAATYKLARTYSLSKKWDKALQLYEKLEKRDPENTSIKLALAYVYAMSGELDKSIFHYKELYLLQGDNENVLENYASVLIAAALYDEAASVCANLEEKFPDNTKLEKLKKAIEDKDN